MTREKNWTITEEEALVNGVEKNKSVILGKLSSTLTTMDKKMKWNDITEMVNAVSTTSRNDEKVSKKWSNWSSNVKKKNAYIKLQRGGTGGGPPPPPLTALEERVINILGPIVIDGIDGGLDTMQLSSVIDTIERTSALAHNILDGVLNTPCLEDGRGEGSGQPGGSRGSGQPGGSRVSGQTGSTGGSVQPGSSRGVGQGRSFSRFDFSEGDALLETISNATDDNTAALEDSTESSPPVQVSCELGGDRNGDLKRYREQLLTASLEANDIQMKKTKILDDIAGTLRIISENLKK